MGLVAEEDKPLENYLKEHIKNYEGLPYWSLVMGIRGVFESMGWVPPEKKVVPLKQYKTKLVIITAMTWDEVVQYGIDNGGNVVDGLPWSFKMGEHAFTHDCQTGEDCYLISNFYETLKMNKNDMLILAENGIIIPCSQHIFEELYESVV